MRSWRSAGKDERELLLVFINQPDTTALHCEQPNDGFENHPEQIIRLDRARQQLSDLNQAL
jgi:hypothetical protein